jgi:hypothetical protein
VTTMDETAPGTKGLVLHSEVRYYDFMAWLLTLGREGALRERLVDLARLEPGDAVLDVVRNGHPGDRGQATRRCGGHRSRHRRVAGDDRPRGAEGGRGWSRRSVSDRDCRGTSFPRRAFRRRHEHVDVAPSPEAGPATMRARDAPGAQARGRALAVDFATPARERKGLLGRFHRHGHLALRDIVELLSEAGLRVVESPRDHNHRDRQTHVTRSLDPLPAPRWLLLVGGIALVGGHGIVVRAASSRLAVVAAAGSSRSS